MYHAAYLEFAERARTEMLRCLGLDHSGLRGRFGLVFTVRRCAIDYRAPARLDDLLEVETRLLRLGGASLELEQRVLCQGRLLARLACVWRCSARISASRGCPGTGRCV